MWIINCMLMVFGTVAAICGLSFYMKEKDASGNIRIYIFMMGITSAVWCYFFGMIGFCEDFVVCGIMRKFGDFGVVSFLVSEIFMVLDISNASRPTVSFLKIFSIIMGITDYYFFSQDNVDIFVRRNGWTTWISNPEGEFARLIHLGFVIFSFAVLFSFACIWLKNNKIKRLNSFLYTAFVANFSLLFFSGPDTYLPAIGKNAIATSGIGAAVCAIVMWYGAAQLNSFDIHTGNIRDRLFEFIEAGVIVLDTNHTIALMNRYSRQLAESRNCNGSRLEDFFDITPKEAQEMIEASVDEIYLSRLWNKEGSRAYSVRLNAVKDKYHEVFCFMCVFVDVTEEVEAVAKFEVASRAKSRFLAQMSHEIRTPINAVLGMNEMILRESENPDILEYAWNIDSAGKTLLTLINSILDFSKIEDGKMDIVPVRYDTASFINDLCQSVLQKADAKGLAFILDVDEALPCTLIGDDVRVSQVIMNLLSNAVKYTEKGSVTLVIREKERTKDRICLHVCIKDTGIGIKEEDLEKLFESFERLDEVRNHNIEGTGLGISIVKSLLDMMGSSLKVKSTYGEGSEFSFDIEQEIFDDAPIGDYEKRLRESSGHRSTEDLIFAPDARILVVDDNDMNLKVARNLLKLCGICPEEAGSGKEAIDRMRKGTYDILFLDHMMPELDGIETLKVLKKENLIPETTAVIALTANAVVGARENYLKTGFHDYLSKPIELRDLVEKLKMYLPERAYGQAVGKKTMESVPEPEGEVMEFAPEPEEEVMEFAPEPEGEAMEFVPEPEEEVMGVAPGYGKEVLQIPEKQKKGYDIERLKAGGINVTAGLNYCADDKELYFELLSDFVSTVQEKLEELYDALEQEDCHGYEIRVHALKSNAKMMGLVSISKKAKRLEDAAGKKELEYVREQHVWLARLVNQAVDQIQGAYIRE